MTGWNKRRVLAAFLLFGSGVAATLLVLMVGSMVLAGSRAQLVPAHDMSNYAFEMEQESDELVVDDRFAMAEEASGAPGRSEGGGSLMIIQGAASEPSRSQTKEAEKKQGLSKEEGGQEGQVRSWFPESFLWQPVVITDATGTATVEVQVPDQLTTWRVLGLAHSPEGRQAGAVHTFNSRLPVYVDPVVPAWLYVGDALDLPVQVVNMTDAEARLTLTAEGSGALVGGGEQSMVLGPSDTDRTAVRLVADSAGLGGVGATLTSEAGNDEARRQVPVLPVGRPVQRTRGGSLASARQFVLKGPAAADPATQALSVRVYPGPLAVFQSEVERLQGGAQPADGAYGFALSARMSALGAATGVELDTNAIRTLQLLAWQRIVQDTRSPNAGRASDLLASMAGVSSHPLVDGLRPRLVSAVVQGQRADGTWSRQANSTLQAVLVQTAWAARSLPASEEGARLRAAGALERYAPQIEDPYTAAVILASGVADAGLAQQMRTLVLDGIRTAGDGARSVSVPRDVVNPWNYRPSRAEVLAWTALALADQEALDWRFDLVSELMSGYNARWGFGAGPADGIALQAIAVGMAAVTGEVEVVLSLDGEDVARATVDPTQPRVPAVLVAQPSGADPKIGLRAEPTVPGLAFVASLESWVPWTGEERIEGVEVEVSRSPMTVGRSGVVTLTLAAPSGVALTVEQGLPAGCVVDEVALDAVEGLVGWDVSTDRVRLQTRPLRPGEILEVPIEVQPAFAGVFSTPPLSVQVDEGSPVHLAPTSWRVSDGPGS